MILSHEVYTRIVDVDHIIGFILNDIIKLQQSCNIILYNISEIAFKPLWNGLNFLSPKNYSQTHNNFLLSQHNFLTVSIGYHKVLFILLTTSYNFS